MHFFPINEVYAQVVQQQNKGEHIITIRTCLNTGVNISVGQNQRPLVLPVVFVSILLPGFF